MAATLGVPIHQATTSSSLTTSSKPIPLLRATRSASTFRTPNSSDNDLSADGSHTTADNSTSVGAEGHSLSSFHHHGHPHAHALSLSPPPDLSFSKSSLHSDQEIEFLSRNAPGGGSSTSFNQPYLNDLHLETSSSAHHPAGDQVRIASSSQGHDIHNAVSGSGSYPYHQNDSWGTRRSGNNNNALLNHTTSKSRIRLDSVFGTQLPGFPYLNSAAAATSSALGNPINPHYYQHNHHGSTSSADLLRGRASYNWTERSGSAASHHHHHNQPHTRAPTSHSIRSTAGKESSSTAFNSVNRNGAASRRPGTAATMHRNNGAEIETSCCSGETGESNSSDEVDLDLSFDMDLLRARQMQQFQARQARELRQQEQHVGITSSQVQAQRQARSRALSATGSASAEGHSKAGHVGIDMRHQQEYSDDSLDLPHRDEDAIHRRYMLGGKKRMSRSAVELRPGSSTALHAHASNAAAGPSSASTPRGPTPATVRNVRNHPYRYSGAPAFSSTMPASTSRSTQGEHKTSRASLDLAVDIPLEYEDTHGPRPAFMDEDESSAQLGWSFATTPPLSPAEIVTFAEGAGSTPHHGMRRYSAGASNLFHSLDRRKSSSDMLQRKRRPSFPLMSLLDKAIRAPVAGIYAGMRANDEDDLPADQQPHSPDSDPSWGSPTPRESVVIDATATIQAPVQPPQLLHNVPLIPIPSANSRRLNPQASISDLARTPESVNDQLPAPPRLHDPARGFTSSPISSVGTPGTLSPDMCNTNSTFSSPRSPSDDLPTPRTADFGHADVNRYSQFSMHAVSEGGISYTSDGSESVEAVHTKRQSKLFGIAEASPMGITANLHVIPEDNDSPHKSVLSSSSSSSAIGASPKKVRPPSADLNQRNGRGSGENTIQGSDQLSSTQQQKDNNTTRGHKRQSSSLFRFPFVSSLRNPFAASRPATPSIITTTSPNVNQSPSSSQESPSGGSEELLSSDAIAGGIARKDTTKRSTSPNSSEESHFLTPTDPPSPPRPGATSQASKGVDPSMLRDGPNTGKGRLSGLGLSFPSTFVTSQPRSVSHNQTPVMHHQAHRQASLPVLSFSAASDEQHDVGSRSVESEEAAIHVLPDENGYGRPVGSRNSSDATRRSASYGTRQRVPVSAPATTVQFNQETAALDGQMEQLHTAEFGANQARANASSHTQQQTQHQHLRRPRTRLLSGQGLDLRGRIDRMRPSQLLFLAAFIAGPWCFILGGWCLRSVDGDYRSVKGIRCRCPDHSDCCECQAEVYKQIKLSGGQVDRVLQSQNGEVRKMDRFVLANRVGALTCGTGTLVLAITALIVTGRTW